MGDLGDQFESCQLGENQEALASIKISFKKKWSTCEVKAIYDDDLLSIGVYKYRVFIYYILGHYCS